MNRSFRFFAVAEDIKKVLKEFESLVSIKYAPLKIYKSDQVEEYGTYSKIENLGISQKNSQRSNGYLIIKKEEIWRFRAVKQIKEQIYHYFLDQELNNDSICLWSGGLYQKNFLIVGEVNTTCYDCEISAYLYKSLKKSFSKITSKVPGYFIGDGVYEIKDQVRLITMGTDEPIEYDLKLPDKK